MPVKKLQLPAAPQPEVFDVPKPAKAPGFAGDMPLPVGEVMKPVRYTDAEKAVLEKLGVKEGDAIPADLAQRLGSVGERLTQEALAAPQLENRPPLKMPEPVPIDSLTADHQAQIQQALKEASVLASKANTDSPPVLSPEKVIEIKNDLKDQPAVEAGQGEGGLAGSSSPFVPSFCPHCNWELSQQDIPDPDEDTKIWYLQAILGNVPFEKTYSLMGNMVELTFRELTMSQNDWIFNQAGQEMKANQDSTVDQFLEVVRRYRLCLQLKSVKVGETFFEIPGDGEKPRLKELFDLLIKEVLNSASLVNLASRKADEFNRLISKLEAAADRENFWPAA